ncbi:hypothetical protein PHSC3_001411 [Chlamydiales bacterium STE3]|nr:hypothetical protein PHSC3_001411 [Chlamydiales bacterium STE3]
MEILLTVILWVLMGGMTSYFAARRGRDPFAWFWVGILLGLIGLLLLFLLPVVENVEETQEEEFEIEAIDELTPYALATTDSYRFRDWFFLDDRNQQLGPVSFQNLRKNWLHGKVSSETFVWSDGMETWQKVQDLPGFQDVLG